MKEMTLPELAELEFWWNNNQEERWTSEAAVALACTVKPRLPALLALARRALEQPAPTGWVAVEHKAPPTGLCVLVDGGCAYFDGTDWRTLMGANPHRKIQWAVTHWQPLPAPPEGRKL